MVRANSSEPSRHDTPSTEDNVTARTVNEAFWEPLSANKSQYMGLCGVLCVCTVCLHK